MVSRSDISSSGVAGLEALGADVVPVFGRAVTASALCPGAASPSGRSAVSFTSPELAGSAGRDAGGGIDVERESQSCWVKPVSI